MNRGCCYPLVQVKESNNLPKILGFLTSFHKQSAIMKGKANNLLHLRNDVHVTQPTSGKPIKITQDMVIRYLNTMQRRSTTSQNYHGYSNREIIHPHSLKRLLQRRGEQFAPSYLYDDKKHIHNQFHFLRKIWRRTMI